MVELSRELVVTLISLIVLFIYTSSETGNPFVSIPIILLFPLILRLRRIFLVYLIFASFSLILILYPFILNLGHVLNFFLFGMIPFIIIVEAGMSYCNLERIELSLGGTASALIPLFLILPLFILNWRNLAFTSAEVMTPFGFFYLFLIFSIVLSVIIFLEIR